uniref:Venom peptide U9-SYTX-Sth1a n=1 Tax=Scytodes thoracica TaxID=1112478 RepID=A0A0A0V6Z5_SCYTH|nr:venom peptide U9-SYTX-Sth1a [Scytodes thoracica]
MKYFGFFLIVFAAVIAVCVTTPAQDIGIAKRQMQYCMPVGSRCDQGGVPCCGNCVKCSCGILGDIVGGGIFGGNSCTCRETTIAGVACEILG